MNKNKKIVLISLISLIINTVFIAGCVGGYRANTMLYPKIDTININTYLPTNYVSDVKSLPIQNNITVGKQDLKLEGGAEVTPTITATVPYEVAKEVLINSAVPGAGTTANVVNPKVNIETLKTLVDQIKVKSTTTSTNDIVK